MIEYRLTTYRCVGENFIDGVKNGLCGDLHSLDVWMSLLFRKSHDFLVDYFHGWSNDDIVEYIYKNTGKRLVKEEMI